VTLATALARGAVAGAVGTAALNAATYVDMAVRGRPASRTPEQTVERLAELAGHPIPGEGEVRRSRETGIGALLGLAAGTAAGVVLGAVRGDDRLRSPAATLAATWVTVMVAGNGPMTLLGITDPRAWTRTDWAADVLPHVAYAVAATATFEAFERP
jgi:hypothetical protein